MINKMAHIPDHTEKLRSSNLLPGMAALGSGYNVFGEYASPNSITYNMIDWNKCTLKPVPVRGKFTESEVPEQVTVVLLDQSEYRMITGKSIAEYQSNLNTYTKLAGSYSFFSGSISANFSKTETRNAKNEFSYIQQDIEKWALKVDIDDIKNIVLPDVQNDIDNLQPTALFRKFGTHFLTGIIVGGRATNSSATNQVGYSSEYSLEVVAEMSYQSLTGQISAENKTKYGESISTFESRSSMEIYTLGGDATKGGQHIITSGGFDDWAESINDNPVFMDFTDQHSLAGIWELASSESRKEALMIAYKAYAEEMTKELTIYTDSVTAVTVIAGNTSEIQPPPGFIKDPYDLNRDAGGDYIYVCYKMSSADDIRNDNLTCITDLAIIGGEGAAPPPGYTKIDIDLNAGAGGDYLYLCYKSGEQGSFDNAMKSIMVVGGNNPHVYPPEGYTRIDVDLNADAGGDYIYLCWSKTL